MDTEDLSYQLESWKVVILIFDGSLFKANLDSKSCTVFGCGAWMVSYFSTTFHRSSAEKLEEDEQLRKVEEQ